MNESGSLHGTVEHVGRIVHFYETLTESSLRDLGTVYRRDAFFKDPFNEVAGIDAIEGIFRHMFRQVDNPRFVVTEHLAENGRAFLVWDFLFSPKGSPEKTWRIHGATHLRFDSEGLVSHHRDYWDAAEELYEKIPVLGTLMRWLKRAARR